MRHLPVAKSIKDAAAEQFSLGRSVHAVDVCILCFIYVQTSLLAIFISNFVFAPMFSATVLFP